MSPRPVDSTDTVSIEALRTENQALRVENQLLRDEIARLKGLPPRPPAKPSRSSGMETATDPSRSKRRKGRCQTRGAKRDSDRVTRDVIVPAEVPEGSRFKPTFPRWTTLQGASNQIWPSGDRADASSARIGSGWQHGRKPSAADRPLSLAPAGLPLNRPARQPSSD